MAKITRHAYVRFLMRRPGAPRGKLSMIKVERSIRESFGLSWFISIEEARARIGPVAKRAWNQYFRADGTGPGVWVTCWSKGEEVVLTYLYPRPIRRFPRLKPVRSLRQLLATRKVPARI